MSSRPFKPKWSLLKATQESLRQSWAERKRLGEELAFERRQCAALRRALRDVTNAPRWAEDTEAVGSYAQNALDAEKKRRAKRRGGK